MSRKSIIISLTVLAVMFIGIGVAVLPSKSDTQLWEAIKAPANI